MRTEEINNLKKPEGQSETAFKAYKDLLFWMPDLTNEQVASLHFESWDEARTRAQ